MMLTHNRQARRSDYPESLKAILDVDRAAETRTLLANWPLLRPGPTPLFELPGLADRLGVAVLAVKDESQRSELASFKALGAPAALVRLIERLYPALAADRLLAGASCDEVRDLTVISASAGNHGRALAAAAQSIGCACVIVLHAKVSEERAAAIEGYGAKIARVAGNYDDSVAEAARLAAENGWHVVSDTSYAGYEAIPRDVMQGYGCIAAEVVDQAAEGFTHVFLQSGVGGLAAGIASYFWQHDGRARPRMIVVEPTPADCLYQSAVNGVASEASGNADSLMAGLACGRTSPLAWTILAGAVDDFMTIDDAAAVAAMRIFAAGSARDIPVLAGESGAAGLAGLIALVADAPSAAAVGLGPRSRVLLINSEGATAPKAYRELVGETPEAVRERQARWRTPG